MLCQRFNSVDYISFNRMLIQMHLVKMLPLFALESARLYHENVEHACFNDYQIVRCIFFAIPFFASRLNWFLFSFMWLEKHEHDMCTLFSLLFSITESVAIELNTKWENTDDGKLIK